MAGLPPPPFPPPSPAGPIDLALREWPAVCDLLLRGRFALLLRKGGIAEHDGPGRFRLEHDRFALFPAREHQNLDWLKPDCRPAPQADDVDTGITIGGFAEVARIWVVPSRAAFDRLDGLHPWAPPQIDMRFDYKPDRPLYLVALKAWRLMPPRQIPDRPAFAGCKSWIPLDGDDAVPAEAVAAAAPSMDADALDQVLRAVDTAFVSDT